MSNRLYTDEQESQIADEYQAGSTLMSLAEKHGTNTATIRNVLKRRGCPTRSLRGRPPQRFQQELMEVIRGRYEAGLSQEVIAAETRISQAAVSRLIRQMGIARPHRRNRDGHGNWKGGRISFRGYVMIWIDPDDEFFAMATSTGYVMEHRLVVARALGRPLTKNETVHHINGDTQDNRLENLQLRKGKHGNGQVMICGDCGSTNLVFTPIAGSSP